MPNPLSHWPGGRWIAVAGAVVGLAFFVQRLAATDDSLLRAFVAGCGGAFANNGRRRVTSNDRLYDLEKVVFNIDPSDADEEE